MGSAQRLRRFAKLTGRSEREVAGARWQEFDLAKGVWRLSKKRSDDKKAVEVALSEQARALVSGLSSAGMLFPSTSRTYRRAASRIRAALDKALGRTAPDWTWHDLRRTCATGLQRLGVRLEVTEAVLNHVSGSRAGIVQVYQRYDYLDEKRTALEAWANDVLGEKPAGKVVAFKRG